MWADLHGTALAPATADAVTGAAGPAGAPTPTSAPAGAGAAGGGTGELTADGVSLLPVAAVAGPDGALSTQVDEPATAAGVTVQSVPADEGFWVGTSATDRVWVQLTGTDESGYAVKQGDRVDFTGQFVVHDAAFPAQVGVDDAEGAAQLAAQAAHIQVAKSALALSAG